MEDLYNNHNKNVSWKAFFELVFAQVTMEEIYKIVDKKYHLKPEARSEKSARKSVLEQIDKVLKMYSGKIDKKLENAIMESEDGLKEDICAVLMEYEKRCLSSWERITCKDKKTVKLEVIQGEGTSLRRRSFLHPHLELVPIKNTINAHPDPGETA